MSATTIFFNGRLISRPGSYSEVDASGLEGLGLGASGIIGVIGEAEGGIPVSVLSEPADFIRINKPSLARSIFHSGDLREVCDPLFAPSKDPDILGGAQEIVAMKVNPATKSTGILPNAYGNVMDITSDDYGARTAQVNVQVGTGTNKGKLLTVTFEDVVETGDDIGGDIIFNLKYTKPTNGWDVMTSEVESGGNVVCDATRAQAGLDGDIATQLAGNDTLLVTSAGAGDIGQQVVVYGLDAALAAQSETFVLNGVASIVGIKTFSEIHGARIIGTTAGIVTVSDTGPVTVLTIAAGVNTVKGLAKCLTNYVSGSPVSVVADGATTQKLILVGKSATGAVQLETLTLAGAVTVVGTGNFSEIDFLAFGEVEAARTITVSAEAARSVGTTQNTMQKVADYYNARFVAGSGGFVFTLVTGLTTLAPSNLDITTGAGGAVSSLDPANPAYYADNYYIISWFASSSQYASAALSSGAVGGAPTNTVGALFLTGGIEGVTAFANWQAALNLLKKIRVNSVVVMSGDPAVHAAVEAHCAYMGGIGKSERDGFVGLLNTALDDVPTKTEAKAQIVDLNSRHIRAFGQAIERYNTAGERVEFLPPYQAAVAAGMQAGSPVGTSLTYKYADVLALRQAATWNPTDDAEEMIQAGLCFMETIEGVGRRVVRNVTTHLVTSNLAFVEGSVNEAVNYAVFSFRQAMESAVGDRGFAGTISAARGVAEGTLRLLVDETILTAYRSLGIELTLDVLEVTVEVSPILPINFVKNTIHLVTIPQTAV